MMATCGPCQTEMTLGLGSLEGGGPLDTLIQLAQGKIQPEQLLERVTIESAYGPTVRLDRPLEGPTSPALRFLRPRVTIELKGLAPITLAPGGDPPPTKWPAVQAGLAFLGVTTVLLAGYGAKKLIWG